MKPEYTKPFCLADAKAGAPYCQRDGLLARVGIWDARSNAGLRLVGVFTNLLGWDISCEWTRHGQSITGIAERDLVMLPLGYCEGLPVFVGDELRSVTNKTISGFDSLVWHAARDFDACTWPRKEPVIPSFTLIHTYSILSNEEFAEEALNNRAKLEVYWTKLDEFNGVWK